MRSLSPQERGRLAIVRLPESSSAGTFAEAVARGLGAKPKTLPCRYFYDARGSELFEEICGLPEYYLTRSEDTILRVLKKATSSRGRRKAGASRRG